jgi:hypothetical protein
MDDESFDTYLKKGGRSDSATSRCIRSVDVFEKYIDENCDGRDLVDVSEDCLDRFVEWSDEQPKPATKTYLWALRYYFQYSADEDLSRYCSLLRQQRIKRTPFSLSGFRGVSEEHIKALETIGIKNINHMLAGGATRESRKTLSEQTGIPESAIVDLVRLSDLGRIQGIKSIRARLYVDAGVDSIEKLADSDPEELREDLIAFVKETNFDGIAPLPAELRSAVKKTTDLPKIVEY